MKRIRCHNTSIEKKRSRFYEHDMKNIVRVNLGWSKNIKNLSGTIICTARKNDWSTIAKTMR